VSAAAIVGWLSTAEGPQARLRTAISLAFVTFTASVIVALASFLPVLDIDFFAT
jgi:hypothetical protein